MRCRRVASKRYGDGLQACRRGGMEIGNSGVVLQVCRCGGMELWRCDAGVGTSRYGDRELWRRAARVVTRRRWTAPVPEMVWKEVTRFSLIAGLSPPRMSFCDAEVNWARPAIGRYSWLRSGSEWRMLSAW